MTPEELAKTVIAHGFNVTLTGGDPLQHPDMESLRRFVALIRAEGLRVWCYTGYTFEELTKMPEPADLLGEFEAIVEGPFIAAERDTTLPFRGSRNQRILRPDGSPFPLSL